MALKRSINGMNTEGKLSDNHVMGILLSLTTYLSDRPN